MKSLQWLLAGPFTLSLAATLFTQNTPAAAPAAPKNGAGGTISISASTSPGVGCCGGIKGKPFSAEIVREFTHVLADGNRIHRETHGATYRDAEGRTRTENDLEFDGLVELHPRITIMISDPVAGTHTTLSPQNKTATINHYRVPGVGSVVGVGGGVGVGTGGSNGAAGAKSTSELLQDLKTLQAEQIAEQGVAEARVRHERQQINVEPLGTKEIEGFTASGTRHSRTFEAGAIGNDRPITSTSESWFSEDLKMAILILSDDPQSGQRTMRLTNIRLGDPDPQLFQIPADYTVKDIPAREEVVVKPSTAK